MKIKSSPYSNVLAVLLNLVLVYVLYMVTRVLFRSHTGDHIQDIDQPQVEEDF